MIEVDIGGPSEALREEGCPVGCLGADPKRMGHGHRKCGDNPQAHTEQKPSEACGYRHGPGGIRRAKPCLDAFR